MKKIGIGVVGAGTVGQGLLQILTESVQTISSRSGIYPELRMICDKNPKTVEKFSNVQYTGDFKKLVSDPGIDIVVELVGGTTIAFDVVREALNQGKTVVTANKALLSEKGKELFTLASEKGVEIGYEAAVAGTIPIIRSIKTGLIANDFVSLYGILNGTTNFILSKMEEENLDYEHALSIAQELGFAEKDPTFDVEGIDAAHKVSLLAGLAFNRQINIKDIYVEGISKVSKTDIQFAKELGFRIKLLGICKQNGATLEARVHPTMIPISHPLANVRNEMNAIYVDTSYSGPLMFSGKGAGSLPTASAVASDLVYYASRIGRIQEFSEKNVFDNANLTVSGEAEERFYLRFTTVDRPGVIGTISGILGNNQISIASVRQNESRREPIEVIFTTHKAKEDSVRNALKDINQIKDIIKAPSVMVRLEELP